MRYWTIKYTALYKDPKVGIKQCDIPAKNVVTSQNEISGNYIRVAFRGFIGWIYSEYVEELVNEFPPDVVKIEHPTPIDYDAAQYIVYNGTTQYNLCGEMAIAHIFNDSIENFLSVWKAKPNSYWKRVFGEGKARGTSDLELVDMANVYANAHTLNVKIALRDTLSTNVLVSPARLQYWLDIGWRYIASVKISGVTGDLQPTGILHWVVVDKVVPDGVGRGWVELYNPYPNRVQRYSWKEFTDSCGIPYGIFVRQGV